MSKNINYLECRWNPPKYDCCLIEKLRNYEYDWVDIGYDKKELTEFTGRQLKTCNHFSLPTIENFRVSYYGGEYLDHGYWTTNYWGGEFIQMKLDNQTIIQCNIQKTRKGEDLNKNGEFQQDISGSCHILE